MIPGAPENPSSQPVVTDEQPMDRKVLAGIEKFGMSLTAESSASHGPVQPVPVEVTSSTGLVGTANFTARWI